MARAQFWDQFNLSTFNLNALWENALSRDPYIDEPAFTFRGTVYDDILVLYSEQGTTRWWFEQYGTDITLDEDGLSGGSIKGIANWFREEGEADSFYNVFIDGFEISALALTDALITPDRTDDLEIFQQIFASSDSIRLSNHDDDFFGWAGHDTIRGGAGNDTISGDAGQDSLSGEKGRDVLFGGSGNDMLIGGRGKDTLTGDRGADQFVFGAGDGRDTVTDFEDGIDRIVISSGAAGMNDLTLASVRGGVTVAFGTVEIMLAGETLATITAADFDFA